jgi:DnaK suppressor protein
MNQEEKAIFKKNIKKMIATLESEIAQMEESAAPISPENAIGRVSRMDAINNKGVVDASLRHRRRKLVRLQMAVNRVDNPDFGYCSNCKKPIQPKRLILMPDSDRCVKCA